MCNYQKTYRSSFLVLLLVCGLTITVQGQNLKWHSFEDALAIADSTAKPILLDVWAPWCGWCHKMKTEVYPNLKQELAQSFILSRLNRDDHQSELSYNGQQLSPLEIAQQLRAEQVPTIVLLTKEGKYLLHLSGFRNTKTLRPILQYVSSEAYRHQTYEQFQKRL